MNEDEVLEAARRILPEAKALIQSELGDVRYKSAKSRIEKNLSVDRRIANAAVKLLHAEGFMAGRAPNVFEHPDWETAVGIVQGARRVEGMWIDPQDGSGQKIDLPPLGDFLPGDWVELRRPDAKSRWRAGGFIRRGQTRWVCRVVEETRRRSTIEFQPISPFAPFTVQVPAASIPEGTDLAADAVELELAEESLSLARDFKRGLFAWNNSWGGRVEYRVWVKGVFRRTVGRLNDPLGEVAIAAAVHGIPVEFSAEARAEAAKLPDAVDGRSLLHRVDLTDVPLVTIDGEDSRDFDDAVYCEETDSGWRLLVAIADVSHYVRPGSALDRDAQLRGTSVYFPASVVPMLPEKLSNGLCSLNPGVDRLALVCDMMITKTGETAAYQFYPAVMHSHARLTYGQVWRALGGEAAAQKEVGERMPEIMRLYSLYKALREARRRRHALDFETTESQAVFACDGSIQCFKVREMTDANRIIEECMLAANVCAAQFVVANRAATLFRCHPEPEASKLTALRSIFRSYGVELPKNLKDPVVLGEAIEASKAQPGLQTAVLRSMARALYTPENIGHYGLQYKSYAHFTSPIRRYPDLLLHRTIRGILQHRRYAPEAYADAAALLGGFRARQLGSRPEAGKAEEKSRAAKAAAAWRTLGILTSSAERRADDASRDVMNWLKCRFMAAQGPRTYSATVTGMCSAGVYVTLDDMPIEGFVHVSALGWGYWEFDESSMTMRSDEELAEIRLGESVRVFASEVDPEARRIDFRMEPRGPKIKKGRRRR